MPEGAVVRTPSAPISRQGTPDVFAPTPLRVASFPQYEVPEEVKPSTPDPIKVIRAKKKGTGMKKRTAVLDN